MKLKISLLLICITIAFTHCRKWSLDEVDAINANPCATINCFNGGTCLNGFCDCPDGYTGENCENELTTNDPCYGISCYNGGVCINGVCDCTNDFTGTNCQTPVGTSDPCDGVNCLNGGYCDDGECECPSGYTGTYCQTEIQTDPCDGINCLNGGYCDDGECECPSGYTGTYCQTQVATEGAAIFWTNCSVCSNINIWIASTYVGYTYGWYASTPFVDNCTANYCLTVPLNPGTYTYTAQEVNTGTTTTGTFTISAGSCSFVLI